MENAQDVKLIIGIEDRLSWWQNIMYAIQQLTVDTTILIVPVLLARALKLPAETSALMVQAALIGAGLVTIGQALWVLRLPVLQGPAIVFVSVVPTVVAVSGLAAAWTGLLICSLIAAVLSLLGVWGKLEVDFWSRACLWRSHFDGDFHHLAHHRNSDRRIPKHAGICVAFKFYFCGDSIFHRIACRASHAFEFPAACFASAGRIVAIVLALISGTMTFAAVGNAPWLGFSAFFPFGFQFDLGATLVMLLAFIADLGQVIGSYVMVGEVIGKQKMTSKRIDAGVLVESVGSVVSSALGGLPTVTYNQNIGALIVTGIGSRFVFATAGVILVILGLCPKVGAIIASIPAPIVGGLLLVTIAMLCMQSIRVLGSMPQTNANLFAAGTGIVVGIGVTALPQEFIATMPSLIRPFVSSGIIMSFLVAGLLHVVFNLLLKTGESDDKQIQM